jgi:thioesterase domain-containing protein/acyl carrier protein
VPVRIYLAALAQRRLWFLDQLQGPTAAYNVHVGLWLYGPLDLTALQSSIQAVVDRHESLRTCFALAARGLIQIVVPNCPISLPLADFAGEANPYPPAYELAKKEVAQPFDLIQAPLFRARIMRIAPEEHVLFCTMHHAITDAWSLQVFVKELSALYQGFSKGTPATLPELPIQYGDYAEWQHRSLETELIQKQIDYWRERLKNAPRVLHLPGNAPRPSEQTLEGASRSYAVPAETMLHAKTLALRQGTTLFTVLLAALKVLLFRYSGQTDILVGVPVAGRSQVETEGLIGFFVDTLVLRDNLSGNPRFLDLLAEVRETTLAAFANGDVPFDKVVEVVQPERHLGYNPIFQVMFSVIQSAIRSHSFADIEAHPYVVNPSTSILDLTVAFIEDSDSKWWLQFDFNTSLFSEERIARMCQDYVALLDGIAADPEARVHDLPIPGVPRQVQSPATEVSPANSHKHAKRPASKKLRSDADSNAIEEALLAEIWKGILGTNKVGIRDNFFDLGGHSLLAARLVQEIQRVTGRKIPVSAIFRAPTVESLAKLLKDQATFTSDPALMMLREGTSKIPLFAVAAPGVDSLGFGLLARHVGDELAVYKLQGAGPAVWNRPFEKEELSSLAQQYIAAMRTAQAHGPYCFAAMCDGVLIAQQMVLELESQGEQVSLFAIFDTWVLEGSQIPFLWALDYNLQQLRSFVRLPGREQIATLGRFFSRKLEKNRPENPWNRAYWPGTDFQPPEFRGPILLFKRPRQPYFYVRDPQMGWGKRSRGGVEICEVNCGHLDFLRPPHVQTVGRKLEAVLREINGPHSDAPKIPVTAGSEPDNRSVQITN